MAQKTSPQKEFFSHLIKDYSNHLFIPTRICNPIFVKMDHEIFGVGVSEADFYISDKITATNFPIQTVL